MITIGIDLGNHGAIAYIDDTQIPTSAYSYIFIPEAIPMPKTDNEKWIHLHKLATTVHKNERHFQPCQLFMEDIQIYTSTAVNSYAYKSLFQEMGKFMAWCVTLNIPYTLVHANVWQNYMNSLSLKGKARQKAMAGMNIDQAKQWCKDFDSKGLALRECKKRYPGINLVAPGCRTPHDGMVDAILIATWGKEKHGSRTIQPA